MPRSLRQKTFCLMLSLLALSGPRCALALAPAEVAVIANQNEPLGLELARYYMRQRHIPDDQLILIDLPSAEICSRTVYRQRIADPVRAALAALRDERRIRCLVTVFGVPLKIGPDPEDPGDPAQADALHAAIAELTRARDAAGPELKSIYAARIGKLEQELRMLDKSDSRAAVDAELALVLAPDYPLDAWLPNPYYLGFRFRASAVSRDDVLIVGRLDGPDPQVVRRMIDDTLQAEQTRLPKRICLDARWPAPLPGTRLSPYALYDQSIHQAAQLLRERGWQVTLDEQPALLQQGACGETALYCGWYSLANYVDAFSWLPGAIGYHIASAECSSLHDPANHGWCRRSLEQGAAATIGPVYEPYVQAFPLPALFFQILTEGYLSLGETYLVTLPYLSWQMILVGDPLYRPFAPLAEDS